MKSVVQYTARGRDKTAVENNALEIWREFIGNPDATLPSNAIIQIQPETDFRAGDGTVTIVQWSGDVIISQTSNH